MSLPGRLIAAYEWFALEWHELSARATEQYMPARTACLAFIQAFRELTEQSGGTLVLEPTRRSDRKAAGHGSPVTEADILAKLAKLRADLEACGLAAEDAEQLQALVDKMEAMLGAGR